VKFGIFYEHQLPRPWNDGEALRGFQAAGAAAGRRCRRLHEPGEVRP
jgi:hypothetical protein